MDRTKIEWFKHHWSPPRELNRSRPREVRITHAGAVVRGLGIFLTFGAPIACLFIVTKLLSTDRERDQLARDGKEVNAEVVNLWKTTGENKRPRVAYRFELDGKRFDGKSDAPLKAWNSMQVGSPIPIRFLPAKPQINHPADWSEGRFPVWVLGLLGAFLCAVGGLVQWRVSRQRGFLEEGRAAPGVVTKFTGTKDGRIAHYEFLLLNGSVVKGRCQAKSNLGPVGGEVCVVYDPDHPRRSNPYPMIFWKLANNTKL
jgi:uncharacterized protein DUF3592